MTTYCEFNAEIIFFFNPSSLVTFEKRLGVFKRPMRFFRKGCLHHSVFDTYHLNFSNEPANFLSINIFCSFEFVAKIQSVALEVLLSILCQKARYSMVPGGDVIANDWCIIYSIL